MKQSAFIRVWHILYPVCIYYIVTTLVLSVLVSFVPQSTGFRLFAQLVTSLAVLKPLYRFYRQSGVGQAGQKMKNRPGSRRSPLHGLFAPTFANTASRAAAFYAAAFLTGGCFALALNNVLGALRIADYSASYGQVTETFYTGRLLLEIAALAIVIPAAEELLYRGIVYVRIKEWLGVYAAVLGSAVIFGIVHMNLVQFVYATIFGVLLACFTEWGGGVGGALAAHMAANLTSVLRAETEIFAFLNRSAGLNAAVTVILFGVAAAGICRIKKQYASA